jgi:hypothetical protein
MKMLPILLLMTVLISVLGFFGCGNQATDETLAEVPVYDLNQSMVSSMSLSPQSVDPLTGEFPVFDNTYDIFREGAAPSIKGFETKKIPAGNAQISIRAYGTDLAFTKTDNGNGNSYAWEQAGLKLKAATNRTSGTCTVEEDFIVVLDDGGTNEWAIYKHYESDDDWNESHELFYINWFIYVETGAQQSNIARAYGETFKNEDYFAVLIRGEVTEYPAVTPDDPRISTPNPATLFANVNGETLVDGASVDIATGIPDDYMFLLVFDSTGTNVFVSSFYDTDGIRNVGIVEKYDDVEDTGIDGVDLETTIDSYFPEMFWSLMFSS